MTEWTRLYTSVDTYVKVSRNGNNIYTLREINYYIRIVELP